MQLIVLGMHRSGTSAVTRLINMAGAYFGPEGIATSTNEENPKGFWERRDVRRVCDGLLQDSGFDWWKITGFAPERLDPDALETHLAAFRDVLAGLDAHRPWVLKEPRLCLLLGAVRPLLEVPVVIQVTREPMEVVSSLATRNGFSLPVAAALWEHYTLHGLRASVDIPRYHVRHGDVLADPVGTLYHLLDWLEANDVAGLHRPSEREITAFVDPDLHRARSDRDATPWTCSTARKPSSQQRSTTTASSPPSGRSARHPRAVSRSWRRSRNPVPRSTSWSVSRERSSGIEQQRVDEQRAAEEAAERRIAELTAQWETRLQELDDARTEAEEQVAALQADLSDRAAALAAAEASAEQAAREREVAVHEAQAEAELAVGSANHQLAELQRAMAESLRDAERKLDSVKGSTLWKTAERAMFLRQRLTPGIKRQDRGQLDRIRIDLARVRRALDVPITLSPSSLVDADPASVPASDATGADDEAGLALPSGVILRHHGPVAASTAGRSKVAVLAWDVGHNPLGRANVLAELLARRFDVELWGAQFDRYGDRLWAPLRQPEPPGQRRSPEPPSPSTSAPSSEVAGRIDADALVGVQAPRFPSCRSAILAKQARNRPLVLDVDDHELAFFDEDAGLPLDELPAPMCRPT